MTQLARKMHEILVGLLNCEVTLTLDGGGTMTGRLVSVGDNGIVNVRQRRIVRPSGQDPYVNSVTSGKTLIEHVRAVSQEEDPTNEEKVLEEI